MIKYQAKVLKSAGCHDLVVVTGYRAQDIENELRDDEVIIAQNNDYESGRVSSIKVGVLAAPDGVEAYVFLGVDQPSTPFPRETGSSPG